ncbi:MAG: purine-nucleoside phosphorylase, partial [Bacteroidetes bacterium]|nr:purine-nucleoside phosphorylase [Bacteroidota bacterium]
RVMKFLGVERLLISNAAGALNRNFQKGDVMIMSDHINLLGDNPLIGPNDEELGPRFPDMSEAYNKELIGLAEQAAFELKIQVRKGVYAAMPGPNLETAAEYRFLQTIGADAIGMSTVPEVIAAVHMGIKVLGFSILTDECFPEMLKPTTFDEIVKVSTAAEPKMTAIMKEVVKRIQI